MGKGNIGNTLTHSKYITNNAHTHSRSSLHIASSKSKSKCFRTARHYAKREKGDIVWNIVLLAIYVYRQMLLVLLDPNAFVFIRGSTNRTSRTAIQ